MSKVRRIDWSPDEYIAGTFGRLTWEEHGFYIVVLNMIYSSGGPIPIELDRLAYAGCSRPQAARRLIDQLVAKGKLRLTADGLLTNGRAARELGKAADRIEDARRAGKASGATRRSSADHPPIIRRSTPSESAVSEKRSGNFNRISGTPVRNYQPSTINSSLSESLTDAAREPAPDVEAPARAPALPEPERAPRPESPEAKAQRELLAEITAAKRAAFLKGSS
jgi:uncharacterized protein YdaU (DUF1376 family)